MEINASVIFIYKENTWLFLITLPITFHVDSGCPVVQVSNCPVSNYPVSKCVAPGACRAQHTTCVLCIFTWRLHLTWFYWGVYVYLTSDKCPCMSICSTTLTHAVSLSLFIWMGQCVLRNMITYNQSLLTWYWKSRGIIHAHCGYDNLKLTYLLLTKCY